MIPTHCTNTIVWTINNVSHSLCLSVHHLSEIRSSVSLYLVRSRSRQALFLVPVVWHPLWPSHMLARLHRCDLTEWAQSVPLCHLDSQIPLLIHTLQLTLSECLKATFMITQLRCDVWCPQSTPSVLVINTISWSKELGYFVSLATAIWTSWLDLLLCLLLGVSITSFIQWHDPVINDIQYPWSGNHDHHLIKRLAQIEAY